MEKGSPRAAFFVYEITILQLYNEILHGSWVIPLLYEEFWTKLRHSTDL